MNDHRIFDRPSIITGQYDVAITERQLLGPFGVQRIDPPVLGIRSSAAEVETQSRTNPIRIVGNRVASRPN
jgi:hypothetical protein